MEHRAYSHRRSRLVAAGLALAAPPASAKQWVTEHAAAPEWRTLQQEAIKLANAGRTMEALRMFEDVVKMERSSENVNNLAVALGQAGRHRESHETFLRSLNLNANNPNAYDAFVKVRPRLSFDLAAFVAKERRKHSKRRDATQKTGDDAASGDAKEPSSGEEACAAVEEPSAVVDAVPSAMAHLTNRTNGMRPWASSTVLVIAHWKEDLKWTERPELAGFPKVVYQRHRVEKDLYSPNVGFEAGIYLQFIVEHYWNLPEQVFFLQADVESHLDLPSLGETARCVRAGAVPFFSLSTHPMISRRNLARYTGAHPPERVAAFIDELPRCAKKLLSLFGVEIGRFSEPTVSAYCCAVFTASRAAIRRHPYSAWRAAYEMVAAPSDEARCIWNEATARARRPGASQAEAMPALGLPDLNEAFLMEHLWHVIFGQPMIMKGQRADETCKVAKCGKLCPGKPELGLFG